MSDIYAPCLCGSKKKFKFCCYEMFKKHGEMPSISECYKFPVYECKIIKNWKEVGISPVIVSRKLTKDLYVFISYLIDFWCLGLKDTIIKFGITQKDLSQIYNRYDDCGLETISYQDARSLILGAIDFAKIIEIAPHSSWDGMFSSFVEAHLAYEKKFSFGQEGKHHYVFSPNDNELYNVQEIMEKVSKAEGHVILHLSV